MAQLANLRSFLGSQQLGPRGLLNLDVDSAAQLGNLLGVPTDPQALSTVTTAPSIPEEVHFPDNDPEEAYEDFQMLEGHYPQNVGHADEEY